MLKEKYSKPCCIKVGVGVGVGLVVIIAIIVAATVVTSRTASDVSGTPAADGTHTSGSDSSVNQPPKPVVWPHSFGVQLESDNFAQVLAVDDATQTYIVDISRNQHYNLYIIVDFRNRQHGYIGIEKGENKAVTNVVEKKVIFCHMSPFDEAFNGRFVATAQLREAGTTYREQVSGRTVSLDARYVDAPYDVSATLAAILNGSCEAISTNLTFQWKPPLSHCGDNTTLPADSPPCSNSACPSFPGVSLSVNQACTKFRQCNYVMGKCDSFWATSTYDGLPYCVCRSTILADMDSINCPSIDDDEGDCVMPKRDVVDFETFAPCYCRYQISRIYPVTYPTSPQTINWVVSALFTTAPANNFKQCPC